MHVSHCTVLVALFVVTLAGSPDEPNPPVFGQNTHVFGPETAVADIKKIVQDAFAVNGGQVPQDNGQFSSQRFAFLFKPGSYDIEIPVGYYTQVMGLGTSPNQVKFTSSKGVFCEPGGATPEIGALNTFWRSAENFQSDATYSWPGGAPGMLWAASQAAPLRKIIVSNNLQLFYYRPGEYFGDFASGGYLSNSWVKGDIISGSQQQYITRSTRIDGQWSNGVWNQVFVGVQGAPKSHCGADFEFCNNPYVTADKAPIIAEKPYISISSAGKFSLNIPQARTNTSGPDFDPGVTVPFEQVFVARPGIDDATSINDKLAQGLHVVLSAGIYYINEPLKLNFANQVLLGLGMASIVPVQGTAAVQVGDVDGVRVAGFLIEAGDDPDGGETDALVEWGNTRNYRGDPSNPGLIIDVFARVGGPKILTNPSAEVMIRVNSDSVIGDHLWLWRADHNEDGLTYYPSYPVKHGLVVWGNDVTMYGLFVEHTLQDQVMWHGESGKTYFFQCELPYDVDQENFGDEGFAGYRVMPTVKAHNAWGIGVYHFFRDYSVVVESGIVCPENLASNFVAPFGVYLNGLGVVNHVINDQGNATNKRPEPGADVQWVCNNVAVKKASTGSNKYEPSGADKQCNVGDPVLCPRTKVGCAGNTCCPDGSTCPSADNRYGCCQSGKTTDCTTANQYAWL